MEMYGPAKGSDMEEIAMKNIKVLCAAAMLLCMLLGLCACGGSEAAPTETAPTEAPVQEVTEAPVETEASLAEGMANYTVRVVDEAGNPVAGAMVQLCKDSCVPGMTDAEGAASFTLPEDDYKASMLSMPAGFEYAEDTDAYYFEDGAYELTIVLKAVA